MVHTAFAAAFAKANVDTDLCRLLVAASNLLSKADLSPERCMARFLETIETDRGLLRALALQYLRDRAADMSGQNLVGGGQALNVALTAFAPADQSSLPRGQVAPEAHSKSATGQPVEDETGHIRSADKAREAVPISSSPKSGDGGHRASAKATDSLPPSPEPVCGGGQGFRETHLTPAPAAKHNPPRSNLASLALVNAALSRTVMDTFKVRDGRPIGDLAWNELNRLARTNEYEARILRYVEGYVANPRPGQLVRDLMKPEVVEAAIKHAAEAENVG